MTNSPFFATVAALAVTVGLMAAPAQADPMIDFGTGVAGSGGTLGYAGGGAALVGSNIRIGLVSSQDTPLNSNDQHSVSGSSLPNGLLSFTTGAFQGYAGGAYNFGSGGSFQLFGNVPDAGISDSGSGALLLSGTFDNATISKSGSLALFSASGTDTYENPQLVSYFGIAPGTTFNFSSFIMATGDLGAGTQFSVTALNAVWANDDPPGQESATAAATPEPASLVLLGSGLSLVAWAIRRRKTQARPS
jgi:PEP-CTERM motif-containing protein